MALYTRESIERVRDAVDMVELVGARTDLRRVGGSYTGLCPFHEERTPSFSVNAEKKVFYCFGCGESGDAIRFVEATEALDFPAAVEMLADRYGVELRRENEDPRAEQRRRRRERLLALVERAAAYYERYLWESGDARAARDYLSGRGLGEQVLRDFRIGFSPPAWDRVVAAAGRDGYRAEELAAAGLAQPGRNGGFIDRFRGRIMFPLADARGRVLGFGARSLSEAERPKYLNTSENELYHKGRQLFGIHRARGMAAKRGRIVAVEGYTDVLALHQGGITESVAIMGTALTQEQLAELGRAAGTVYLAMDADRSGQEAMLRAARGARERDVELLVAEMPEGTDPAELVSSDGAEAFERLLDGALSVPEFEARRLVASADLRTPHGRDRAIDAARPLVGSAPANSATRDEVVRFLADKLDVEPSFLTTQIEERPIGVADRGADGARRHGAARAPRAGVSRDRDAASRKERTFIAMCLAERRHGREYLSRLDDGHLSSDAMRAVRDHVARHFDDPLVDLPADDPMLSALVTEVALRGEREASSQDALRLTFLELELQRIERELRHATRERDFERQRDLWPAREGVKVQINELMGQTQ
ncbi:MAG: DNA primase [Actinobacteria bacterium]|nr:DNA primase [Actinomycetota bacterium]